MLIAGTRLDRRTAHLSLNLPARTERTERHYADLLSKYGFGNMRVSHSMNFLEANFLLLIYLIMTEEKITTANDVLK